MKQTIDAVKQKLGKAVTYLAGVHAKIGYIKVAAYFIALLLLSLISAIALAVSTIPIIIGAGIVLVSLTASGVIFFLLKFTNLIDANAKVFFLAKMWHWAVEIPSRISAAAYKRLKDVPVLGYVIRDLESHFTTANIMRMFDNRYRRPKYEATPHLHGDLMRACHEEFNPEYHKDMYEKVPSYLQTNEMPFSRLKNGSYIVKGMAPNVLWSGLVASCVRRGLVVTLFWFSVGLCVYHPTLLMVTSIQPQPVTAGVVVGNYWSMEEKSAAVVEQQNLAKRVESFRAFKSRFWFALLSLPLDGLTALLFASLIGWGAFRGTLKTATASRMEYFADATPDAEFEFAQKSLEIEAEHHTILTNLKKCKWDQSPKVVLGFSTGWMAAQNAPLAPIKGTPLAVSMIDAHSHIICCGNPGTGKTKRFLEKYIKQHAKIWLKDPSLVHLFIGDDKGVLGPRMAKMFKSMNIPYRMIGVDPVNEYAIDIFDDATPAFITNLLIAVLKQNGGGQGDQFWLDMADLTLTPCGTILQAVGMTEFAIEYTKTMGHQPFSFAGLREMACDVAPYHHTDWVLANLFKAIKEKTCAPAMGELVTPELWKHVEQIATKSRTESGEKTRDSIVKTIEAMLNQFLSNSALNAAFGNSMATNLVTIDDLRTHHFLINMPSGDLNKVGAMVNSMIYMRLFNDVARNQTDGTSFPVQMIIDEAQEQICCSGRKGAKDWQNVPGMCREQLLSLVVATQNVDSIRQNIGDAATKVLITNMGTRLILSTLHPETLELVTAYAPEVAEYRVLPGHFASYLALKSQTGYDVHSMIADRVNLNSLPIDVTRTCWNALSMAREAILPTDLDQFRPLVEEDKRFINMPTLNFISNSPGTTMDSYRSSMSQAVWRAEDKRKEILASRTTKKAMNVENSVNLFSNNYALCLCQNADGRRIDVVDLDYDEDTLEIDFPDLVELETA